MSTSSPKSKRNLGAAHGAAPFAAAQTVPNRRLRTACALAPLAALALLCGAAQARGPQGPSPSPIPPPLVYHPLKSARGVGMPGTAAPSPSAGAAIPGAPNPIQIVLRMVRAQQTRPFIAREVELAANGRESEQWVRWDPHKGMRMESLRPAAGDILLDDFKQLWSYSAREKKWTASASLLPKANGRVKEVLKRIVSGELRTEWVGQEIVAGRASDIIRVFPSGNAVGPSRKFWVDRKTGVRLKMEEIGPAGRTQRSSYFLSLDLSPRFGKEDFTPPPEAAASAQRSAAATAPVIREDRHIYQTIDEAVQAGIALRQPSYLPSGFVLRHVEVVPTRTGAQRITQRYANGITVISIVQSTQMLYGRKVMEQLGPRQTGFVPLPRGDRAYVWRDAASGFNFAILANLSDDQIRRIAASVR